MSDLLIRPATTADAAVVAEVWHRGWHDAHRGHVPAGLTAARTAEAFAARAVTRMSETTVAETGGSLVGFVMVVGDEVEQVYVDRGARGTGVAEMLLAEAERQVGAAGHPAAWLAVVVGNERARRFYERCGWVDEGDLAYEVEALGETYVSPCRRYTKTVGGLMPSDPLR